MSDVEYHARPELSSTGARLLLPEYKGSPAKFRWDQSHKRTSAAFDFGHVVHAKVLGVGLGIVEYPAEHITAGGNVSTSKAAVAWASEQRSAGFTVVSAEDAAKADLMAEAVLLHPFAGPLFEVAEHREVSVFADVDGVPCRARFDALSGETRRGILAVDLKSAEDATPSGFTRSIHKWGYDVQLAHYEDTYLASEGRRVDEFWIVAVEKSGPFEVAVHKLDLLWAEMGHTKAAAARRIYRECVESGEWPGYAPTPHTLAAPAYAVIEHELEYEYGEVNV